jgi:(1->4)-alpha-D-glucan 1-alpha-D-glucosylmutase
VTHVYLSPVLQAAPGSTHGYDVVDHSRPSDQLGGWDGHARLVAALAEAGLGQVLDIVPNHMAIGGPENRWWWDVLENGPSSIWASHFDVTWDPPEEKLRNTVLMPILGDHYGKVLDAGQVRLEHERGDFTFRYFDHVLPVGPRSLSGLLARAARDAGSDDLAFIATALRRLPLATRTDPASVAERHRDTQVLRRQLVRLLDEQPAVEAGVDAAVAAVNADVEALDELLEAQNYRIAHWRTAGRELGYRRFFAINTLVGLRVEDEEVFADTHELILRWVSDGVVDGLRVDHPDGLRDPEQYFARLAGAVPGTWIVAEKILEPGEALPPEWPVAGTSGYDRLALISGLFVQPEAAAPLTASYGSLTGAPTDWDEVVASARAHAVSEILAADVTRLSALLVEICEGRRDQRDRTRHELHEALQDLLAAFPVYRTYVRAEAGVVRPSDVAHVSTAVSAVAVRRPDIDPDLLAFLTDLLLLRLPDAGHLEHELVMRFQQLTGPAMAKGVEDTAFYRFNRLLSLNEVGGAPGQFGVPVADFHAANRLVQERWPTTMTTLSTHDTKRSADVRARLHLLSEVPSAWAEACGRWMAASASLWPADVAPADRPTQHLLFQTLVGAWPLSPERAVAYMAKATKEAKLQTSWTSPDPAFDAARDAYVSAVLGSEPLMAEVAAFVAPLVPFGRINALAQVLVALTGPGVPDIYQGSELWDLSLVDPDNRRPVDFSVRRALLAALGGPAGTSVDGPSGVDPEGILARSEEGLPKLRVVHAALQVRRRWPEAFGPDPGGSYVPLGVRGSAADHAVGFTRGGLVAVVVPRLVATLAAGPDPTLEALPAGPNPGRGAWGDTAVMLPPGRWVDVITGAAWFGGSGRSGGSGGSGGSSVSVGGLLDRFPVGLLERSDA